MRLVIDTNIWFFGLLWRGKAWSLLKLAEQGRVEICIAYPMLLELEEVLAYDRLRPRLKALQETPSELTAYALSISTPYDVSRVRAPIVTADPDDDIFLLCAAEARADVMEMDPQRLARQKWMSVLKKP